MAIEGKPFFKSLETEPFFKEIRAKIDNQTGQLRVVETLDHVLIKALQPKICAIHPQLQGLPGWVSLVMAAAVKGEDSLASVIIAVLTPSNYGLHINQLIDVANNLTNDKTIFVYVVDDVYAENIEADARVFLQMLPDWTITAIVRKSNYANAIRATDFFESFNKFVVGKFDVDLFGGYLKGNSLQTDKNKVKAFAFAFARAATLACRCSLTEFHKCSRSISAAVFESKNDQNTLRLAPWERDTTATLVHEANNLMNCGRIVDAFRTYRAAINESKRAHPPGGTRADFLSAAQALPDDFPTLKALLTPDPLNEVIEVQIENIAIVRMRLAVQGLLRFRFRSAFDDAVRNDIENELFYQLARMTRVGASQSLPATTLTGEKLPLSIVSAINNVRARHWLQSLSEYVNWEDPSAVTETDDPSAIVMTTLLSKLRIALQAVAFERIDKINLGRKDLSLETLRKCAKSIKRAIPKLVKVKAENTNKSQPINEVKKHRTELLRLRRTIIVMQIATSVLRAFPTLTLDLPGQDATQKGGHLLGGTQNMLNKLKADQKAMHDAVYDKHHAADKRLLGIAESAAKFCQELKEFRALLVTLAPEQAQAQIDAKVYGFTEFLDYSSAQLATVDFTSTPISQYQKKSDNDAKALNDDMQAAVVAKATKLDFAFVRKLTRAQTIVLLEIYSTHNETFTHEALQKCKDQLISLHRAVRTRLKKLGKELEEFALTQPQEVTARVQALQVEFSLTRDAFYIVTLKMEETKPKSLVPGSASNNATDSSTPSPSPIAIKRLLPSDLPEKAASLKVFTAISDYAELVTQDPLATDAQFQLFKAAHEEVLGNWKRAEDLYTHLRDETLPLIDPVIWARANYGALRCYMQRTFEPRAAALSAVIGFIDVNDMRLAGSHLYSSQGVKAKKIFPSFRSSIRKQVNAMYERFSEVGENSTDLRYDAFRHANQDYDPLIYQRLLEADAIIIFLSPDYFESQWCVQELTMALQQNRFRSVPLKWVYVETLNASVDDLRAFLMARLVFDVPKSLNDGDRAFVRERLERLLEYGTQLVNSVISPEQIGSDKVIEAIKAL